MPCPCGSGKEYEICCGQYIQGRSWPENAVELMRSRYTAYTLKDEAYLIKTWHASTRPAELGLENGGPVKWIGLNVIRTEAGGKSDEQGMVEFEARCKVNGKAEKLHEASRFVKENEMWYYLDGEVNDRGK